MKRIITLTLSALLALSLCACAQSAETPVTTNPATQIQTPSQTPSQTQTQPAATTVPATTLPAVPTEEELETLNTYKSIVTDLYDGSSHSSLGLKDWYNQLQALDLTVIDKWQGTQYTSDDIQWDYNTVLSDFLIHGDVLLGYKETKTDALDNSYSWEYQDVVYDANGFATYDFFGPFHATESMGVYKDTYHFSYSIVDGQLSFYENDPLYQADDYRFANTPEYFVREDGTVEKISWSYNGEVRAVYRPQYDADGKLIRMEITDQEYDYTVDYVYDDQGRLTEICTNNLTHPDYFAPWINYEYDENGRLSKCEVCNSCKEIVESTDYPGANTSFNFTAAFYLYDENGQLSKIQLQSLFYTTTGDSTTRYAVENLVPHYDENGRLLSFVREHGRDTHTYELIYGDYYLFVPSAQQ